MSDEHQEIKVVSVEKGEIKMSLVAQVWSVPFKLSLKPNQDWEKKFYEVQLRDKNVMKRKMKIAEGYITVEVAEMDDLQKVLDVIKLEVAETNMLCEGDYQTKLKVRRELEILQQRQGDATDKFRENASKLQF